MNTTDQNPQLIIHDASAGSGKTFTLVKNYLQICLDPEQPIDIYNKILAITFTNKAAKEMKDRIIEQLEDFVLPTSKNEFILDEFAKLYNCSKSKIKKRAFKTLQHILHNFSQFSVSTIDKFMLKIIRSIQYEIGLKDSFELIMDYDEWFDESIDELIDEAEKNKKTEKFLFDFVKNQIVEDKTWSLEYSISEIASNLIREDYVNKMGPVLDRLNFDEIIKLNKTLETQKEDINNLLKIVHENYQNIVNTHNLKIESFARKSCPLFKVLSPKDISIVSKNLEAVKIETLIKRLSEMKFFTKKSLEDIAYQNIQNELEMFCSNHLSAISKIYFYTILFKKIANQIKDLQFEFLLNEKLNAYLERHHKLPIGALNGILDTFIKKEEIPMLMMKMGEKYEYIFIDEFQDTSDTQWSNLYPFVENVLSNGYEVHLIGDGKQSIYRFRGGDVKILLNLKENRDSHFYDIVDAPALTSNWRSGKDIVEFNNALFSETILTDLTNSTYQNIYSGASQKVEVKNEAYVEINSVAVEKEDLLDQNMLLIHNSINHAVERGFNYQEICILCRTASEISDIAKFLLSKEIPFTNADSLLVFSDANVQFLFKILEFQIDQTNLILKSDILSYIYYDILHKSEDFTKWIIDQKELSIKEICAKEQINFPEKIENNYYEYLEAIILCFGISKNIYTLQFLEIVFQQSSKGFNQIHDFINLTQKGKEKWKITPQEDQDAIKILTIHKSKGLEYPIVILPFLNKWTINNSKDEQWYNIDSIFKEIPNLKTSFSDKLVDNLPIELVGFIKEVKDEFNSNNLFDFINLFYVACTRASQELYFLNVFIPPKKAKDYKVNKQNLTDFIMDHYVPIEHWSSDYNISFGKQITKTESKSATTKTEEIQSITSNTLDSNWNTKIKIAQNDHYNWCFDEQITAQQQGNHIHNIMAMISNHSQINKALNIYFSKRWIPEKDKKNWAKIIREITNHPELRAYFEKGLKVWNERDWLGINGETLRPDRVVQLESNKIVIMDYKTGKPDSSHQKQIEEYARQLAFSELVIEKCILVYTENIEIKTF